MYRSAFRIALPVLAAALISSTAASANDRYVQAPPVIVSPDLSAPWVMQLRRAPVGTPRRTGNRLPAGVTVRLAPTRPRVVKRAIAQPQAITVPRYSGTGQDSNVRTAAYVRQPAPRKTTRQMDPMFLPTVVDYDGKEKAGTIIIDTNQRFLFLVEAGGKARRYGVGVAKPGFEWAGTHKITDKKEWPEWRPPQEMIVREAAKGHYLPVHMAGGPANPLGARALYLGSTLYRIHGTNAPWTIGQTVSSGCIRMRNEDVMDLYNRVGVGTKVIVI